MRRRRNQSGFALLLVLAMMSAAAIMIYLQLPRFVMQAQRAKEQLLIDRGEQYQRAIQLYYRKVKSWPQSIDDLEKGNNTRFLRRRYVDPFTGKADWRLVHVANGVYTDSLVYNTDPNQKPKAQTFVAEMASIGTNGADGEGDDNKNLALEARGSDRPANPLDELPEGLRAFVYAGSIAPRDGTRRRNEEEEAQYTNGAVAPTPGVYGMRNVDLGGLSGAQVLAGGQNSNEASAGASTPVPGVGGISFDEIQRRAAQQAASGAARPPSGLPATGSFIGQAPAPNEPYAPSPTPGAAGLSYIAIAGNDPSNSPVTLPGASYPAVPGTQSGIGAGSFPTGINNPPAPPFGGGGFIGGPAAPQPQAGFGQPGQGQLQGFGTPGGGLGATPGVAPPTGQAQQMLNDAIFGPRQPAAAPAGTAVGGSGLAGVASKYRGETVKVYRERSRYQFWEFIYDPAKDTSGKQPGQPGQTPPLPGGLPPGTAQQGPPQPGGPQMPLGFGNGPSTVTPGARVPIPNQGQGGGRLGGFGNTGSTGGGFIGGPVGGTAAPVGGNSNNGQNRPGGNQPNQPNQPATPPPPPRSSGGFIGGK